MSSNFRPFEALEALHKLIEDPDDTEQAFRIVRSIDGGGLERMYRRFGATADGRAMLVERPSLLDALRDRGALLAMPEGSLGRAYAAFCEREGIAPGGLVEASETTDADVSPELRWFADRMRDSHDLWHVVTGFRTDLRGELSLLAFTTAQTDGLGVGLLSATGFLRSFALPSEMGAPTRRLVLEAFARGRRAKWLPATRWEALLARPLDEVRIELGLLSVPVYRPLYPADVEALAAA
jgi:ubiquinone biosynthesis protein COQ4